MICSMDMSARARKMLVGTTSTSGLKRSAGFGPFGLGQFVHDPVVHLDLLARDLLDLVLQSGLVEQVDVIEHLDAIGVPPDFVANSVRLEEVIGHAAPG